LPLIEGSNTLIECGSSLFASRVLSASSTKPAASTSARRAARLNPMQRLGVARARPDRGGVIYDDVGPTGLQPLVDGSIEVSRRRAFSLDESGVEIMVEQVQPQDIRRLRGLRIATRSAETASTFSRPGSFASVRTRPTGSFLKWATSAGTKL